MSKDMIKMTLKCLVETRRTGMRGILHYRTIPVPYGAVRMCIVR